MPGMEIFFLSSHKCCALRTASKQLCPSYWWPLQITKRHSAVPTPSHYQRRTPTSFLTHHIFVNIETPHSAIDQNFYCHTSLHPRNILLLPTTTVTRRHNSWHHRTSRTVSQICAFGTDPALSHMNALWIKGRFGLSMHRPVILANLIAVTKLPAALFAFHWSVCLYDFISGLH